MERHDDNEQTVQDEKVLVVSADGHAAAPMADYRTYIEREYHDECDAFLETHAAMTGGSRISPPRDFFDAAEIDPTPTTWSTPAPSTESSTSSGA